MKTKFKISSIILSLAIILGSCDNMNLNLSSTGLTYSGEGEAVIIAGN